MKFNLRQDFILQQQQAALCLTLEDEIRSWGM